MVLFERIFFTELVHNHVVFYCIFLSKCEQRRSHGTRSELHCRAGCKRLYQGRITSRGKKNIANGSVLISRHCDWNLNLGTFPSVNAPQRALFRGACWRVLIVQNRRSVFHGRNPDQRTFTVNDPACRLPSSTATNNRRLCEGIQASDKLDFRRTGHSWRSEPAKA